VGDWKERLAGLKAEAQSKIVRGTGPRVQAPRQAGRLPIEPGRRQPRFCISVEEFLRLKGLEFAERERIAGRSARSYAETIELANAASRRRLWRAQRVSRAIPISELLLRLTCPNCSRSGCRMCNGRGYFLKDPYAITSGEQGIDHHEVSLAPHQKPVHVELIWASPPCESWAGKSFDGVGLA
jgi:hypothetical protein